ncbi:1341_t:CDS:2, partial [Gigaspora rosea]
KIKTKHCFMERDTSKLWVIQVDCKNRIHDRVECFWKNKYLGAESNDKKYIKDWCWQAYDENSLSNDEYMTNSEQTMAIKKENNDYGTTLNYNN